MTTSWDDGHPLDLRLADLLQQYGIKGTFYVPLQNSERSVMDSSGLRLLAQQAEIGGHTRHHVALTSLSDATSDDEIRGCKLALEDVIGKSVSAFCYPRGAYNRSVKQAVASAGFKLGRTTKEFVIGPTDDPWSMPTTLQAFPQSPLIRLRHSLRFMDFWSTSKLFLAGPRKEWTQLAMTLFTMTARNGGIWHLWGHSWELEEFSLWDDLRRVLEFVSQRSDVQYMTNGEVIEKYY